MWVLPYPLFGYYVGTLRALFGHLEGLGHFEVTLWVLKGHFLVTFWAPFGPLD